MRPSEVLPTIDVLEEMRDAVRDDEVIAAKRDCRIAVERAVEAFRTFAFSDPWGAQWEERAKAKQSQFYGNPVRIGSFSASVADGVIAALHALGWHATTGYRHNDSVEVTVNDPASGRRR